jgi:PAS domain S-box-containing protein
MKLNSEHPAPPALPFTTGHPGPAPRATASDPESGAKHRLLIIDDTRSIHEDFRKILMGDKADASALDEMANDLFGDAAPEARANGFVVDSAYQGQEGIALVKQALTEGAPYKMAFVDVRMPPGLDGIETTLKLWALDPDLQVVLCTAYSDYSWKEMIAKLGQSDRLVILKKPFDNVEALQLAHALTQKWVLGQQSKWRLADLDRMVNQRTLELSETNAELVREAQERKQAEAALRRSEERFAKAFRASPTPMVIKALKDGRHLDANESFLRLSGFSREELLAQTAAESQIGEPSEPHAELFEQLATNGSVRNLQCSLRTKAGETRTTRVSAETFDLGEETFALITLEDMTERLSLETQLRQAQKMEANGQLASGIAHDFNNILTIIEGHVALMRAVEKLQPELDESLKQVGKAAERAAGLTRQVLAFSRKQIMQLKGLDLNQVVRNLETCTDKVARPAERPPAAGKVNPGKETLLIVEDELTLCGLTCRVLEMNGYQVLRAGTGAEAIEVGRQHEGNIDLLLTDMVMPGGLTGRDIALKLQASRTTLKVIYSSGYSQELSRDGFADGGPFYFLAKPYIPATLLEMVRNCLDNVAVKS